MAVELASAYISLVPSLRGAEKAIEKQLGGAADKTSKSFAGRFSSGATKWMRRGGLAIAGAATAAMGLALKKGFDRLTGIENAQAKLSGLGHSAQGVKRIMDDALASVKGTAFGLDEAASVAASAVASGVKPGKDLERTLKLVADAATISGSSMGDMGLIFNKVAASNKVQGEVIAQLSERGIPIIQLLSKELGTSAAETVKLASQGKINFDTFRKAMEAGMGGAALKSGSTFKGALANVQAALGRLGASVLTGVFPQIRDGMNGLIPILDSLGPAATKAGEVLGAAFARTAAVVKSLGSAIGAVGTILFKGDFNKAVGEALQVEEDSPLVDVLFRVRETAQKAGKALGVAREAVALFIGSFTGLGADVGKYLPADLWNPIIDGGAKARQVFDQLAPAVRNVVSLVGTYLAEQGKNWQSIISGVLPMVVPIVTQVIGFVGEMAKKITPLVGQVLSTVGAVIQRVMPGVQQVLGAVMGALRAIFPIVMQVVGTLLDALNDNWPTIRGIFTAIGDIVGEVFGLVAYVIRDTVSTITKVWQALSPVLLPFLKGLFGQVVKIIGGAFDIIAGLVKTITGVLTGDWKRAGEGLKQIVSGLWKIVRGLFENTFIALKAIVDAGLRWIVGKVQGFHRGVVDLLTRLVTFIRTSFNNGVSFVKTLFSNVLNASRKIVSTVIGRIRDHFRSVADWLRGTFGPAFAKVREWITAPVIKARDVIKDVVGKIKNTFSGAVKSIGKIWKGLQELAKVPIRFIVNDVINKGLIGTFNGLVAKIPFASDKWKLPTVALPKGFAEGGYTGPGSKYQPAGIVHADEFVISKEARRKFEARNPGALDYLNRTGELPGYAGGGRVWPGTTRNLSGNYSGHSGIDIPDPAGAPIRAASDGTISYTGWGRGYGQAIFQRLADGLEAVYGHTSKVLVQAGQAVRAGQVIGRVGSTGRSTGPHIHFEVNPGGGFARASNRAFTLRWLKGAASGFAGATADAHASVKSPFDILGPLIDGAKGALNGAIDGLLKGVPGSGIGAMIRGLPKQIVNHLFSSLKSMAGSGDGSAAPGSFGPGSGRVSGSVGPNAARAAADVGPKFGFTDIGTYPGHDPSQQRALDFMIKSPAQGNAASAYMKANAARLGVMYLIWNRRIWSVARNAEGWRPYTRYGNTSDPSKAHTNHVHASFYANGTVGAQRGLAVVGERGAELVMGRQTRYMRGGERVVPLRNGVGGLGGDTFNIEHVGYDPREIFVEADRRKRRARLRAQLA